MSVSDHVHVRDVTLSGSALEAIERYGIPEPHCKLARSLSISTHETPEFLVVIGRLPEPDGRRVEFRCPHHQPAHIVRLRLL